MRRLDSLQTLPETVLLVALAAAVTVLFAVAPLDIAAARLFYRSNALDPWPLAKELPWSLLYRLAPWITASLVLAGLAALAGGLVRGRAAARRSGIFVLRVEDQRESGAAVPAPRLAVITAAVAALGGAGVLVALFAAPHGTQLAASIPLSSLPRAPRVFEVTARTANVVIVIVDTPAEQISIEGELHGFGLPGSRLDTHVGLVPGPVPTLRYSIEQHGWFTDLDGSATIRVPAGGLERIAVRVERGNIQVRDATQEGVVKKGRLKLDLRSSAGHVQLPGAGPEAKFRRHATAWIQVSGSHNAPVAKCSGKRYAFLEEDA